MRQCKDGCEHGCQQGSRRVPAHGSSRYWVVILVLSLCYTLCSGNLYAQEWSVFPKTEAEIAVLPIYCQVRFNSDQKSAEYRQWMNRLKGGFNHIHHYCAAQHVVNTVNKYGYSRPDMSNTFLNRAIKECEYMEEQAQPGFLLMPEIKVFKGDVYRRLDRDAEAVKAYNEAIRLNKRYTKSYTHLSDLYKDIGDLKQAREILEQGLQMNPKSKSIRRRLEKLE